MNHRQLFITTLLISCFISTVSFAQTLQQAVQLTIDENPEIQSIKSEKLAVEQEIDQAKSKYFPTIDIAAGYGWEQSSTIATRNRGSGTVSYGREESSVELRQMIFDGLATPSEVNRQEARTNSMAYTVFGQSEITALDAVQAYIDILRYKELLELAKHNLLIHQRSNDQIQLRSSRGVGRRADADQSSGRLALAEKNYLSAVGNIKDTETAFLRIVGVFPNELELVKAPKSALPESLELAVEQAISNHPILKSANADIDSAYAQHETAKAAYMPRIDFEASASYNNDLDGVKGKNADALAMVRLRYNIFNGGNDLARREETAQLINQAKGIRDNTYRQVEESMRLSWIAYQTISSQLVYFKEHQDASIKSSRAYQQQFNSGQRTLLDLLDSANEMFVAKSSYTNAKYDDLFAQFRILASKGELNKYLGITLPEETIPLSSNNSHLTLTEN